MASRESLIREHWALCPTSPTGLKWIKARKGFKGAVGDPACQHMTNGYYVGQLGQRNYRAHRVVYFLAHGVWPVDVDHIDGVRTNNSVVNLRNVTRGQNMQNKVYAGCYLCKATGKWRAEIRVAGVRTRLGRFQTQELAHTAYLNAKRELHPFAGERCYA